jgi:hypothetical protein
MTTTKNGCAIRKHQAKSNERKMALRKMSSGFEGLVRIGIDFRLMQIRSNIIQRYALL